MSLSSGRFGGSYSYFGITTSTEEHRLRVRRVVILVSVIVGVELALFALGCIFAPPSLDTFVMLFISLVVPYCGYRGAKKRDTSSLMWFYGCNGFFAILTVLVCILNWSSLAFLRKFCERCHEATIETGECYGKDLDTYEDYCKGGTLDAYERACITSTIISVPLTVLYVLGFYYGRDLWSRADVIFVVADGGGEGGGGFMDGYDVEMTTPQFQGEVGGDGEEDMRGKL